MWVLYCFGSVFHLASSSLFKGIQGEDAFSLELSLPTLPSFFAPIVGELLIFVTSPEKAISSVVPPQSHQFISFKDVSLRDSAHTTFTG